MTDPRKISEETFQNEVRKAALIHGWRFYHTHDSRRSDKGFPDCVLVHPKQQRLIFAELKTQTGKLTQDQKDWHGDLNEARWMGDTGNGHKRVSYEVYVWRPSDIDAIWHILSR